MADLAGDHARPARHVHARTHGNLPFRSQQDIHARSEFDQAYSLARGHVVPRLFVKDDAARDQSGDLLEYHGSSFPLHCDHILLVLIGADLTAGYVELTFLVLHLSNGSRYGRPVYVDVEHIEKDADAGELRALGFDSD